MSQAWFLRSYHGENYVHSHKKYTQLIRNTEKEEINSNKKGLEKTLGKIATWADSHRLNKYFTDEHSAEKYNMSKFMERVDIGHITETAQVIWNV